MKTKLALTDAMRKAAEALGPTISTEQAKTSEVVSLLMPVMTFIKKHAQAGSDKTVCACNKYMDVSGASINFAACNIRNGMTKSAFRKEIGYFGGGPVHGDLAKQIYESVEIKISNGNRIDMTFGGWGQTQQIDRTFETHGMDAKQIATKILFEFTHSGATKLVEGTHAFLRKVDGLSKKPGALTPDP